MPVEVISRLVPGDDLRPEVVLGYWLFDDLALSTSSCVAACFRSDLALASLADFVMPLKPTAVMATKIAMITITMRSSMMVKAGVSLLDSLVNGLSMGLIVLISLLAGALLCLFLVLFIGLILT